MSQIWFGGIGAGGGASGWRLRASPRSSQGPPRGAGYACSGRQPHPRPPRAGGSRPGACEPCPRSPPCTSPSPPS